ncbi:MAG: GH116 family glycosyl-hydrolase [Thermomicrobiales bacterium]
MSHGNAAASNASADGHRWPTLTSYRDRKLERVALPLGGIGTGTVSLGGRGDLHDWEVMNRPAKGYTPQNTFFAIRTEGTTSGIVTRCLEGDLFPQTHEGHLGEISPHAGLPRFLDATFDAAYPFGQVTLTDPDVPVTARLEAFNPLIPTDADRSGAPFALLRYVITNTSDEILAVSVAGVLENFIGDDGHRGKADRNLNELRDSDGNLLTGVFLRSEGIDADAEQWGTMALAFLPDGERITRRTAWADVSWGDAILDFWDDFSADGMLDDRDRGSRDNPVASLAANVEIPAGGAHVFPFLLAWHFPNRKTWFQHLPDASTIGNHYATRFADAWDVLVQTVPQLPQLEAETLDFVNAVLATDIPDVVKEAALYNLSTLRTQTTFRIADGTMMGWEGCHDHWGSCHGSCTHVWNYEQATAFLFGDLARSMRDVEFLHASRPNGMMSFRVDLPLDRGTEWPTAAADGQMGCIMKAYRDWQLHGDKAWLQERWPAIRRALEFAWLPGSWDADQDGVMEGCQHNTMDVEYYGPNPQMGFWYLGALRACEEMARHLGDDAFADRCHDLYTRGSAVLDATIFNGEYYEHHVRPIPNAADILPGTRHFMEGNPDLGAENLADPDFQIGAGCLVDQLVGQYMAHICDLGYLGDREKIAKALEYDYRYNFQPSMRGHFNHLRTFALQNEAAMLMASYPHGNRPKRPFPYFNEVMTGFEYTAAVGMLYEGQVEQGLTVISAIRERYDGERRSPFNEAECGHHYARAMASWAAVLALTGFHYSAVTGTMAFGGSARDRRTFWSSGDAWGVLDLTSKEAIVEIHGGAAEIRTLMVGGVEIPFLVTAQRAVA